MGYHVAKKAWQYMFSRFDTIPGCDGRTDVQPISITCFSIADARKKDQRPVLDRTSPEPVWTVVCYLHFTLNMFYLFTFRADALSATVGIPAPTVDTDRTDMCRSTPTWRWYTWSRRRQRRSNSRVENTSWWGWQRARSQVKTAFWSWVNTGQVQLKN